MSVSDGLAIVLKTNRSEVLRIAAKHGAHNVRLFGSVARGEARSDSDLDLLVEMETGKSLFDIARMAVALEDLLQCKVDIAEQRSLHWYIRDHILEEAVPL
ncbi:MAG: hypothetical protein BZY81_01765 [SAR202 cluster bacterium Io17-Chloro-G4]|nr:MAG: hypothetical protein BZY81_01765 [SAR202 cluster bacterium Io17-Chloro-G4]